MFFANPFAIFLEAFIEPVKCHDWSLLRLSVGYLTVLSFTLGLAHSAGGELVRHEADPCMGKEDELLAGHVMASEADKLVETCKG